MSVPPSMANAYSTVAVTPPGQLLSEFPLPLAQSIQPLGPVASAPTVPEIPRYLELLAYGMAHMGWNMADFDVYRLRLAYPMLSTVTMVSFPKQH